ncbi:MAG: hypothetical protein EOO05_15590 [Chitinophagaceae bacterium]|nr:MAG: hypothetical protein EOO05_15590 [Chitinophagaceae bacterium]
MKYSTFLAALAAITPICLPAQDSSIIRSTARNSNRILVIGGGGARGAWGAGYAKYLTRMHGEPYKVAFGTSTGSLMIPLIVTNEFDLLKTAYTSVTQKSIFNENPFSKKTGALKGFKAMKRILFGKKTFGESKNLKGTIREFMNRDMFNRIQQQRLEFVVTVVDFKTGQAEYKSSAEIPDYDNMVNWMWASANQPIFMSYYEKDGHAYVDGGVMENVPLEYALQYALMHDQTEIDVIINKPKDPVLDKEFPNRKILKGLNRLIEFFTLEIRDDDLTIPELQAQLANCIGTDTAMAASRSNEKSYRINFYYFPSDLFKKKLYEKELLFDKGRMLDMWTEGENGAKDEQERSDLETMTVPKSVLESFLKRRKQ